MLQNLPFPCADNSKGWLCSLWKNFLLCLSGISPRVTHSHYPLSFPREKGSFDLCSQELMNCFGGCFLFCEMSEQLRGGFCLRSSFHSSLTCSLRKPRGGLGQGTKAGDGNFSSSARKSHGSQPAWDPSKALPSSSLPGVAICQVWTNKVVLTKQQ